jgi:hypothetical protein
MFIVIFAILFLIILIFIKIARYNDNYLLYGGDPDNDYTYEIDDLKVPIENKFENDKVKFIIKEFFETEFNYKEQLKILKEYIVSVVEYLNLKNSSFNLEKNLLDLFKDNKSKIIINNYIINNLNNNFIPALEYIIETSNNILKQNVNSYDQLITFLEYLDTNFLSRMEITYTIWGIYVNGKVIQNMNKYLSNKYIDFKTHINNFINMHKHTELGSYIIAPIQRPPRYLLLLKELHKQIKKNKELKNDEVNNISDVALNKLDNIINKIDSILHKINNNYKEFEKNNIEKDSAFYDIITFLNITNLEYPISKIKEL